MLVSPAEDANNQRLAITVAIVATITALAMSFVSVFWLLGLPAAWLLYHTIRRRSRRRLQVIAEPFPEAWESTLISDVEFFQALDEPQRERFRNLVQVFLDEVAITGIRVEVDERTRALVAASAIIPVFGFADWEYSGLGEVLIYPGAFGDDYRAAENGTGPTILGMVGDHHLSGVMILSKPDLIAGFANRTDKRNVGVHEFAHLVDKGDGTIDGLAPGVKAELSDHWIRWVGQELRSTASGKKHIDDYAYTNEAEYFAVLSEYFFEAPELLEQKNPQLYQMLENIYRQNTKSLFSGIVMRTGRLGRNHKCPCGSGQKFKRCCRRKRMKGLRRQTKTNQSRL